MSNLMDASVSGLILLVSLQLAFVVGIIHAYRNHVQNTIGILTGLIILITLLDAVLICNIIQEINHVN